MSATVVCSTMELPAVCLIKFKLMKKFHMTLNFSLNQVNKKSMNITCTNSTMCNDKLGLICDSTRSKCSCQASEYWSGTRLKCSKKRFLYNFSTYYKKSPNMDISTKKSSSSFLNRIVKKFIFFCFFLGFL